VPEPGAIYVMDRGYIDFERLGRYHEAKKNLKAERRYSRNVDRSTSLICEVKLFHQLCNRPLPLERTSNREGLQKCCNLYGRKIGEGVRNSIRQNNPVAMTHCTAGVDDVWHITCALGGFGTNKRFAGPGKNLRRILLVQQDRSDGIFPHGPDAMCQQQPAFVQLYG
jgi:hypothetical protein